MSRPNPNLPLAKNYNLDKIYEGFICGLSRLPPINVQDPPPVQPPTKLPDGNVYFHEYV